MAKVENRTNRPEFAVCTLDNILLLMWKLPPVLEGVERCEAAAAELRQTHPNSKIGFITYVEPSAQDGTPPAPVRTALAKFLKENAKQFRASVVIYEGTGFKATIVRSVVTAIQVASNLSFPASVASSRYDGATWLINQMRPDTSATVSELVSLLGDSKRKPAMDLAG